MSNRHHPSFAIEPEAGGVRLCLRGAWTLESTSPGSRAVMRAIRETGATSARLDTASVETFDSALPAFLFELDLEAEKQGVELDVLGLPDDVQNLLRIARLVDRDAPGQGEKQSGTLERFGRAITSWGQEVSDFMQFFGRGMGATVDLFFGRSPMRLRDLISVTYSVTVAALPIVSLISFLVGLIIAFLGAVVLRQFAAEFAISYLVGYGMLREMGALMTGIIMAGRTGAGFAAEIGSMQVNEEIDALETLGIQSFGFVVMPRAIALSLAMPLLTIYANVVGIFGGYIVAEFMVGVPGTIFFTEMVRVVGLPDFLLGVFKGYVFGVVVALAGCFRGLQCRGGAGAVGLAATRAVVLGITLIIISNAVIDWAVATLNI